MPNHVAQVVVFNGPAESIAKIKALISEEDGGGLDFQKIIPMPASLNITKGSSTDVGKELIESQLATFGEFLATKSERLKWFAGQLLDALHAAGHDKQTMTLDCLISTPMSEVVELALAAKFEPIVHGKQAIENLKLHGFMDWYDWSCAHWGTKWNSYSGSVDDHDAGHLKIRFDTAWSPPAPIYAKLAEMFPDVEFVAQGVDEGWGFAFEIRGENGEIEDTDIPCDSSNEDFRAVYLECYGEYPQSDDEEDDEESESVEDPTVH